MVGHFLLSFHLMVYYSVLFPAVFHGFLSSFLRHRMPAFLCSVPLTVSRPLFLFCRMLSGLFVCLFPGIGCRCSSPLWRGKVLPFTVQSRDHLATITDIYVPSFLRPVRGSLAPRLLLSIPRHSRPAFILSIVPWRIALTWQFEREEPRGAMLRPRL